MCVNDYLHEGSKRSGAEECEVIAPSAVLDLIPRHIVLQYWT